MALAGPELALSCGAEHAVQRASTTEVRPAISLSLLASSLLSVSATAGELGASDKICSTSIQAIT